DTIGGDNDYGDGTVPLAGSIGHELPMDTNTVRRIVDQHTNLHANPWALDELEEVLLTKPIRRRAGATIPIRVAVPDLILAGQPLPVTVDIEPADSKATGLPRCGFRFSPSARTGHRRRSWHLVPQRSDTVI
ncbi:MAG: hypothetical protein JO100_10600, partial [Pseudonocardia sp.]|nr:hypothetical protein [Pseudonocardia sp.]